MDRARIATMIPPVIAALVSGEFVASSTACGWVEDWDGAIIGIVGSDRLMDEKSLQGGKEE